MMGGVLTVENRVLRNILDVESFSNRVTKDLIEVLHLSRDRALSVLSGLGEDTEYTRMHQRILLQEIDATLLAMENKYQNILTKAQEEVLEGEFKSVAKALMKEAREPEWNDPALDYDRLEVLLRRPLGGRTLPVWVKFGNRKLRKALKHTIGSSMVLGESVDEVRRRIQNEFGLGRRSATVLARTSLLETSKVARDEVYDQMKELITEFQYLAVLDSRTCLICGPDDLKKAKKRLYLPQPLRHPCCRCAIVPLTEYSKPIWRPAIVNEEPYVVHHRDGSTSTKYVDKEAKRVVGSKRYEAFFNSQPTDWQKRVLGQERYEIFSNNQLSLDELRTANRMQILTVDQLKAAYGENE